MVAQKGTLLVPQGKFLSYMSSIQSANFFFNSGSQVVDGTHASPSPKRYVLICACNQVECLVRHLVTIVYVYA